LRYELLIALRYLKAQRKQTSISLISGIAIGGVALGVLALVIVLAVMSGLEADLRQKILGASAHMVIDDPAQTPLPDDPVRDAKIAQDPEVLGVSPYVTVKAMVRSGDFTNGVVLRGIDSSRAESVLSIGRQMVQGSLDSLRAPAESALPRERPVQGIVLGEILASSLRVFVGERLQLLIPGAVSTPVGRQARVRTFQVVGIFRTEIYEFDSSWAYTSLEGARGLLKLGDRRISGLEVKLRDLFEAPEVAVRLRAKLGPAVRIRDWRQMNAAFFSALQLEKWAMFIILCLIVMVAAFNIVSSLSMKVMEKTQDIGVLKAIGATDGAILRVFLLEGAAIGAVGTAVGLVLGTGFCLLAERHRLIPIPGDIFNLDHLPFRLELLDVVAVCTASLLISLLTTLYPSIQAARLNPVEAIRNG
jgi:lipoprotein-releasing system permease protein